MWGIAPACAVPSRDGMIDPAAMSMALKRYVAFLAAWFLYAGFAVPTRGITASSGGVESGQRLYQQGLEAVQNKNFPAAILDFRRALQYLPKSADVHNSLGSAYLGTGDVNRAAIEFRKAIALRPDFAEAYFNMAVALGRRDDLIGAETFYRYAVSLRPQWGEAHFHLGTTLWLEQKYPEAITELQKAADLDTGFADKSAATIATIHGEQDAQSGNLDAAIQEFRTAIQKSPELARAHYGLAKALRARGDLQQAGAEFNKAHELDPSIEVPKS